jgi:hypothetical protein
MPAVAAVLEDAYMRDEVAIMRRFGLVPNA